VISGVSGQQAKRSDLLKRSDLFAFFVNFEPSLSKRENRVPSSTAGGTRALFSLEKNRC